MSLTLPSSLPLKRLLGTATVTCVGLGVAIGSGIFATPGEIAAQIPSVHLILLAWLLGGVFTFLESLVTAELSTRIPLAGGDYQFLRAAYGDFAAFFFGWSFTIFIAGAGVGTIASALGHMGAELLGVGWSGTGPIIGLTAILGVLLVNLLGLRAGTLLQNTLTILKVALVVGIGVAAMICARRWTPVANADHETVHARSFMMAVISVLWSYSGSTDSAKLAEETVGARHAIPRGLAFSAVLLTGVYLLYNYGILCAVSAKQMSGAASAAALAFANTGGFPIRNFILVSSIVICLGSIGSTLLSNVRVTFAMARDGLAPQILAKMSPRQAPVASLIFAAAIACVFVLKRSFGEILGIYFIASAVLYGLSYMSLIVFRMRDRRGGAPTHDYFRLPAGPAIALLLTLFEISIAATYCVDQWRRGETDGLYVLGVLIAIGGAYPIWKSARVVRR